ncbi:tyrosine-type recombinase/integrase [Sphingobium phenoxybenzoativorans]|uniref:tyrosine-type recombinase/integrase n=1 Tax=Sphingobium phenoxybenzoativorans TaxID=1592790 RepID=UPI000872D3E3|nr:site-specific integrase [Sphingobium phenoxybenzoativorans]
MPRSVRDHRLENRTARLKLPVRAEPYWVLISEGFHLGYYRGKKLAKWVVRYRPPGRAGGYEKGTLGEPDDYSDADDVDVLNYGQAQDHARKWLTGKTGVEKVTANYTVGDALDDYLNAFTGKDKVNTKRRADKLIRPILGHVHLSKLTSAQIKKFLTDRANAPARLRTGKGKEQQYRPLETDDAKRKRRSTANRDMTVLKAALNLAFNEGHVASDAAWRKVKPFKGADRAKLRYLTDDEARRVVNGAEGVFRKIVQASLLTGARWGELRRLRCVDVDLSTATAWLQETKGDVPRVCYLEAEGGELFKQQMAGKDGNALIFPGPTGARWNDAQQIRRMNEACKAGKVSPPASFHDLRRTYGARLALRATPMAVIAEALGHKDERITRRHYAHLSPSYVADTVRANAAGLGIVEKSNVERIAEASA